MIDVYDHDNGDGFSTADRATYYHPKKMAAENMTAEINEQLRPLTYFEVPKEVYDSAKDLPPYDPSDNSNYLNPNDAEIVASAMEKLGDRIYSIRVRPVRQSYRVSGVWMISLFSDNDVNPERRIPVYINPYCEWQIRASSQEEAEEIACGALLKWFYDRYPHHHATVKKIARGLLGVVNPQNNP